jgi:uncharacterized protein YecE (DUF72 family)
VSGEAQARCGSETDAERPMADPAPTPRGRLFVGTSGFSYASWAPRFYPPATPSDLLLREYAARLTAVELNNTFYQQPTEAKVRAWIGAVPPGFRFAVKAQKGGSIRALRTDPATTLEWLTAPYRWFGERLGSVLYRVPGAFRRDDLALAGLLDAWPRELPLTVEFQDPSWHDDDVLAMLRGAGAVLCATDLDDDPSPPDLRLTGRFVYLRLRRSDYTDEDLDAWAARLTPFLETGTDAYVFFRHDESGESALRALALAERLRWTARSEPTG